MSEMETDIEKPSAQTQSEEICSAVTTSLCQYKQSRDYSIISYLAVDIISSSTEDNCYVLIDLKYSA